jgi:glycosyltransferase involved in cell wall biosynthesis
VGAWILEALRDRYELTVLTWKPADLGEVNRAFGTRLDPAGFHWASVGPLLSRTLDAFPIPLSLLTLNLLMREARRLLKRTPFDGVIGTMNELDVGVPAIQYVHYPWASVPRPDVDHRWYHWSLPLRVYRWCSARVSGYSRERIRRNLTLVNSDWTGQRFESWYGAAAKTVYPPVPGGFADVPWDERQDAFVCMSRISPEKEIDKIIEILAAVRERGHAVRLTIVGHEDDRRYAERVRRVAAPHRAWISFRHGLSRSELQDLLPRHRYGIHGMVGEHFGIAPAELQRAGCIVFVPDRGGCAEIVAHDPRLVYGDAAQAVERIDRVLRDRELRAALRAELQARRDGFSEGRFMEQIRDAVAAFVA